MSISTVKGPWFSLGIHFDLQRKFIDIHFIWWIITIANGYAIGQEEWEKIYNKKHEPDGPKEISND